MAKSTNSTTKRTLIDKANTRMVITVAIASFLVVFSLFASRALLSQRAYQSRVIAGKETAVKQLQANIKASDQLIQQYKNFENVPTNVIGGDPNGTGSRDGDNAKLVLDALPSKYDFPALTTSLEKLMTSNNFKINSITGSDDEANQQNSSNPNPAPIEIPFEFTVSSSFGAMQALFDTLDHSIRPFQIQTLEFTGADQSLELTINAKTFYQPEKTLTLTTKVVK